MEEQITISKLQEQLEEVNQQLLRVEGKLAQESAAREKAEERLHIALAEAEDAKQEYRESEQHYKLLLENTHDVVYAATLDGIITYLGPQMTLFGYAPEELISKNFIEFVAPEQRQEVIHKFKTATAAGESFPTQFQWIHKDGNCTWIEVVGKTVFDESGIPVQQIGVIRNIDERKRQDEEKGKLLLLLDTLDGECFIKDKDGIYQYINRAFETQFGVKREDVIGKDDAFVFGAETAAMLWENDQRIMASKKSEAVEESTTLQDGKLVVYLTNKTPIIDDNGEVTGMCGVGVDITHQKEIEYQLRQSEEKYRALVENSHDVVYAVGVDGNISYMSLQVTQYGYTPEEIIGKPVLQFIAPEDREENWRKFQELVVTGSSEPVRLRWLSKDGTINWVEVVANTVYDDSGQPTSRVGVMRNINDQIKTENALKENRQYLQLALVAGQASLIELDVLSGVAQFDDLGYQIYGYEPSSFEPNLENVIKAIHPEDAVWVVPDFFAALESPDVDHFQCEYRFFRADGELRWKRDQWIILRDNEGKAERFVGAQVDFTEHKQAEEALQESEERFRLLVEHTHDVVYATTPDGIVSYVSPYFTHYGYSPEEIISKHFIEFVAPEQRQQVIESFEIGTKAGTNYPTVFQWLKKDGARVWVEVIGNIILDDSGNPIQQVGMMRDISERVQAQETLQESEKQFRNLVEQITEVIYSVDLEGLVTYVSPAIEDFLGYSPSEIISQPFTKIVEPENNPHGIENFQKISSGEVQGPNENRVRTKTGETRWIRTSSYPIMEGGQVIGVQGVLTDITDRKLAEAQIQLSAASAERERLARELHDSVTQTLYSVTAITDALPRIWDRNQEEARTGLGELSTLTRAALAEMRTLLLELRPEALEKQNLSDLLRQLIDGIAGRTRMPIELDVDGDTCGMPTDVQIALYRITQEALNNIVKHARAGHAQVILTCQDGWTKLLINDDGSGFSPMSVKSHHLGLDIMSERARDIGAEFNINSQPDVGTQISVFWEDQQERQRNE